MPGMRRNEQGAAAGGGFVALAAPYRVNEDETLTFSQANGNAVSVADHGTFLVTVTLSIEDGTLKLADTSGLFALSGDGSSQVTLTGTSAAVNAALEGLAYTGALDANGARNLSLAVEEPASGNLIVNGGAEEGPSDQYYNPEAPQGWTVTSGGLAAVSYAPGGAGHLDPAHGQAIGGGDDYFYGGEDGSASILQTVDLSGRAGDIDAGGLSVSLSGWFGGYRNEADEMTLTVRFLSGNGWPLGDALTVGGVDAGDRDYTTALLLSSAMGEIPAGTRTIEIVLTANGQGDTNDAYADNLSLVLIQTRTESLPIEIVPMPEWIHGSDGGDTMYGTAAADFLNGGGGNDTLWGDSGADRLLGGSGNDRLFNNSAATLFDGGEGEDRATFGRTGLDADFTLDLGEDGAGSASDGTTFIAIESLTFWGGNGRDTIVGGSGSDQLSGEGGADTLTGGQGDDELSGGEGDDILSGGEGNDYLTGGAGANSFDGGSGHDWARIDVGHTTGNNVIDVSAAGLASRLSDGTFVRNIEQIAYTGGSGTDWASGGDSFDQISGGDGNDFLFGEGDGDHLNGGKGDDHLDGGAGADVLAGGAGDDVYVVDDVDDDLWEAAGEGIDRVESSISFDLRDKGEIENLTLTGSASLSAAGNDRANVLIGNSGDNHLDGEGGADRMEGGNGDDRYIVDNARDRVIELSGGGNDTVSAWVSYSIAGQHVETLTLAGGADIRASGNNLANWLIGNSGNNVLNGAGGADELIGQSGNDRYIVDHLGDDVTEHASEGLDRVDASVSHVLGANVENLVLTGNSAINGTGNAQANTIVGNNAGNLIDGKAGADVMEGKGGNDRYVVDNAGDKVFELANGGIDIVDASVSYSLAGQYVETLRLTGGAAIDASGNNQVNSLYGNGAANRISAAGGDDKLYGGDGNDTLIGGAGADRFVFDSALNGTANVDKILDFSAADDAVYLDRSVFSALGSGTIASAAFVAGTAAADANDRILFDQTSGNIWYDADGSGAAVAVLFATVNTGTLLTSADFIGF